jgi:hypothetical protein
MSARRAGPPPGGAPNPLLSVIAIAAALVGGLAAADIVHASITVTLVVSLIVAAIAVFALARWPSPRELPQQQREPVPPGPAPGPRPGPRPGPGLVPGPVPPPAQPPRELDGDAGTNAVVQLLPARPEQVGSDWWKNGPVPPPKPSPGEQRVPAPDLSTYLAFTQIAQCPNCGAFGLEIGQIRGGWGFRCESCSYTWAWRPGAPWPTTRVAPARRRQARPPS